MPIIEVDHVTKEYRLGQLTSFRQSVVNAVKRLTRRPAEDRVPFKALDDVCFAVEQGEVVGIIGHNGAGKSTLLKLLANISRPTRGAIHVRGTVAPLIEVGAGLIGDLTGRENIYLNGSVLGVRRAEIDRKLDEIITFAELEEFIDTPVKRYSSGMQVKLGFSIATSVYADILIVDEVLAVGDLAFQRKCFDRMEDLIKRRGNTVLLVSHNIRQVERMCSRTIMLDHGKVAEDGDPLDVAELFYQQSNERIHAYHEGVQGGRKTVNSSGEVELVSVDVIDDQGDVVTSIQSRGALRICIRFRLLRALEQPELIIGTHTTDFFYLSASSTTGCADRPDLKEGIHEVVYAVPSFPLVAGTYCVRFVVCDRYRRVLFTGESLQTFRVIPLPREVREPPGRRLSLPADWSIDGVPYLVGGDDVNDSLNHKSLERQGPAASGGWKRGSPG